MSAIVSVVVPVYACAKSLPSLVEGITKAASELRLEPQIILVCDASPDESWRIIRNLAAKSSAVEGLLLSRNQGQHVAISAGLREARGDFVVVMDCDLQDDPKEICQLIESLKRGYHVVAAISASRQPPSPPAQLARKVFYALDRIVNARQVPPGSMSFVAFDRSVLDVLNSYPERNRQFSTLLLDTGFEIDYLPVSGRTRASRRSSYSLRKRINLAFDILTFSSDRWIRVLIAVGVSVAIVSMAAVCAFVIAWAVGVTFREGWLSLAALLGLSLGLNATFAGVLSLQSMLILTEVRARPMFVVAERTHRHLH